MKKTLTRLLALCLCVGMLFSVTACGGDSGTTTSEPPANTGSTSSEGTGTPESPAPGAEKVHITYAFWGNESEAASTKAIIDQFNAENDHIEVEAVVIPWESYMETLNTRSMGGTLPDCALMSEAGVLQWASRGMLADVSAMYEGADAKPLSSATYTYPCRLSWYGDRSLEADPVSEPGN